MATLPRCCIMPLAAIAPSCLYPVAAVLHQLDVHAPRLEGSLHAPQEGLPQRHIPIAVQHQRGNINARPQRAVLAEGDHGVCVCVRVCACVCFAQLVSTPARPCNAGQQALRAAWALGASHRHTSSSPSWSASVIVRMPAR